MDPGMGWGEVVPGGSEVYSVAGSHRSMFMQPHMDISLRQQLTAMQEAHGVGVEISAREGSFTPPKRSLVIKIHGQKVQPRQVTVAGGELAGQAAAKALQGAARDGPTTTTRAWCGSESPTKARH
ncbi:MAG: hypothetical protein ACLQOO_21025 [Terriglobia bacterium]